VKDFHLLFFASFLAHSLSEENRTLRGHRQTVESDPKWAKQAYCAKITSGK